MSKSSLIKELKTLTREQLEQVIVDAYGSSREAHDYFEFFLNPDVDKLREKTLAAVARELGRVKWGHLKARVTNIKKSVRQFAGMNPGDEAVAALMAEVIGMFGRAERHAAISPTHERYVARLTEELLDFCDEAQMAGYAVGAIASLLQDERLTTHFRRLVKAAADNRRPARSI